MDFIRRAPGTPSRLGILPGTFNPVTVAHLGLAGAACQRCDEVVFVLPRVLPHKEFSGVSFDQRLELLDAVLAADPYFSLAVADAGLFIEIAHECRQAYGPGVRLSFLCGRDAAERIAGWDYGDSGTFAQMLHHFDLLVARRNGEYLPPAELSPGMERLELPAGFDHVSATEVRERLRRGHSWEHLVPPAIRTRVREIYGRSQITGRD
jgi:nicotinate (nicotinamide) nucleotide adenylyltransferase